MLLNQNFVSKSDDFERANVDRFKVETEEIGVLTKLRVRHDNKGFSSAWYLEKIIVRRLKPPKKDDEEKNEKRKSMKKQCMMKGLRFECFVWELYEQSFILDCQL